MHNKFFAIGLALSFVITGGFLGWQKYELTIEQREAMEPEPVEIEIADASSEEYAALILDEFDAAENSEDAGLEEPAESSASEPVETVDTAASRLEALNAHMDEENASVDEIPAETKNVKKTADFCPVERSYFEDALFVGDSRMVGIKEYGGLKEPTYFANTGLSTFGLYGKDLDVKGIGTIDFEKLITDYQFGKVYIMLGINEAGSKISDYQKKLDSIVADVVEKQPDAIIFLMANLHVTKYKSETDRTYSNAHIDEINATIDKIAAKYGAYYIDANPLFDDGEGNLSKDCAADYAHLKGKCYPIWIDFICSKGIIYDKDNGEDLL